MLGALGQMFYSHVPGYGHYDYLRLLYEKRIPALKIRLSNRDLRHRRGLLAGLMIVPAVFVFSGGDQSAMQSGPGLMFQTLPKVFDSMGSSQFGQIIGAVFFLLVLFAALTSAISPDGNRCFHCHGQVPPQTAVLLYHRVSRHDAAGPALFLGNGVWSHIQILGMDFLTFFDFISNSVIMPIVALLTCIFIGYVVKTQLVVDEVKSSSKFSREKLFVVVIKYVAPFLS